jgi:hypothetical protein
MTTLTNLQTRILVNGKPIKSYYGKSQHWIEARDGTSYSIEVKNNSGNRVLAVISVDGMNVITGKEAEVEPEDGYVISPYSNLVVDGWRISDDEVKEFIFNFNKEESYAVKLGAGKNNLGVIGIAFYSEKQKTYWSGGVTFRSTGFPGSSGDPWLHPSYTTCDINDVNGHINDSVNIFNCSTTGLEPGIIQSSSCVDFAAGTGKGESVESYVHEVDFDVDKLIGIKSIYYDSFDNLKKRGIIVEDKMPKPFKSKQFCPDI